MLPQLRRRRLCRAADDALGPRAVAQPDDGARPPTRSAWTTSSTRSRSMGVGELSTPYLPIALGAGDTTVQRMVNAYAILANQGRALKPDPDRLCPGPPRQGDLAAPTLAALRRLQRAGLGRQGRCRARRSRTRQVVDPMTAYQMVHMLEGVVQRGTATRPARPRPAAVRQDRHDHRARPTSGSSAARRDDRRRRLSRLRPAAADGRLCPGRHASPRRSSSSSRAEAFEGMPVVPFRAPAGIRMVRDRPALGPAACSAPGRRQRSASRR